MSSKYFKYRRAFQRNVHPYDLGVLTGLKRGCDDNHFLLKVYKLDASAFEDYYRYHLECYLEKTNVTMSMISLRMSGGSWKRGSNTLKAGGIPFRPSMPYMYPMPKN